MSLTLFKQKIKAENLKIAATIADATQPKIRPDGQVAVGGQGSAKSVERAKELARELSTTVDEDECLSDYIDVLLPRGK